MIEPAVLPGGAVLRLLVLEDAPALHQAYLRNREHLRPFEPVRPDSFWTLEGQRSRLAGLLLQCRNGLCLPCGIVRDGEVLGTVTLNTIVRGPFCNAALGYWLDVAENGKGLTTAAVAAMLRIADEQLDLHRIEASTLTTNVASQRVLAKNGFAYFGTSPAHLHIAGRWSDSHLYQRILNDRPPAGHS
jgi:ribosomal-protein-alanine N-acetyltransferase